MKRILTTLILAIYILGSASIVFANDKIHGSNNESSKIEAAQPTDTGQATKSKTPIICESADINSLPDQARRGCCSHHGGVCGCNQALDRIICCDNTLSPSCTCSGY